MSEDEKDWKAKLLALKASGTLDAVEKKAVDAINTAAFEHVIYAPTGFFLSYQAWRKNVSGITSGPLPFFWGVTKA